MKRKSFVAIGIAGFLLFTVSGSAYAVPGQVLTKRERMRQGASNLPNLNKLYETIQQSYLQEDYASAHRMCAEYLSRSGRGPQSDEIAYLDALALLKLGRTQEARQALKTVEAAAASEETRSQAALSLADSYFFEGDASAAYTAYEEALKKHPFGPETSTILGRLIELGEKSSRPESADIYKERLVREYPDSPRARTLLAVGGGPGALFTVQVGSFSQKRNAKALVRRLNHYRYDAYLENGPGESLFRVRVGRLSSRENAMALEERLKKDGYPTKIYP